MKFKVGDLIKSIGGGVNGVNDFRYKISAAFVEDDEGVYFFETTGQQYYESKRIDEFYELAQ